jgi:hypothetical protein
MKGLVKMSAAVAVGALAGAASCGSSGNPFGVGSGGGDDGGGSGSGSGGSRALQNDAGSGGSSSGGASSGGSSSGSSGVGLSGGAGEAGGAPPCVSGATQSCCSGGTQTCSAAGELPVPAWGPCLTAGGVVMTCTPNSACLPGETSERCDGGVDAGPPAVCTDSTVSTEPKILVGYSPAMGQTVGMTGQIKVWVNDENSPFVAPGEQVDAATGAITTPGARTAMAADGLLDEPALYIAPATPTNGGTPHFPQLIKGSYNNNPPTRGTFTGGAPIDPLPAGSTLGAKYTAEFVWDVSALGLGPGSYTAVFSVHDGDKDRAIGCVTIVIASGG